MTYVEEFLQLRCAPDVLGVVGPMKKAAKEISEAMGMVKVVREVVLKEPMKYVVVDACAGNGLAGVLMVHLLPVKWVVAIDKRERHRHWEKAQRYTYLTKELKDVTWTDIGYGTPLLVVACHPCRKAALEVIELGEGFQVRGGAIMPCCVGGVGEEERGSLVESIVQKELGKYMHWCFQLARRVEGNVDRNVKVTSPCNGIVTWGVLDRRQNNVLG